MMLSPAELSTSMRGWLVDGQHARLASIESRAATLIGWASAEIALSAIVAPLVAGALDGWRLAVVIVLLAVGGCLAALGAIRALRDIVSTSAIPAVEAEFSETVDAAARHQLDDTPALLLDRFQGSILAPPADGTAPVLPSLKSEADDRASALRAATESQVRARAVKAKPRACRSHHIPCPEGDRMTTGSAGGTPASEPTPPSDPLPPISPGTEERGRGPRR